ncbi:MAG: cyanophycinase [Ignavibacteriales bacterium]|nr:cyanophycinase [Ignavibacteriales bacterium]
MKNLKTLFTVIFLFIIALSSFAQEKGHLVIIGGGNRDEYLMRKFIELAGGNDAGVVIFPMASSEPVETALYQLKELKSYGCSNISFINCNKQNADADSNLKKLDNVKGVFFSGGDQANLTAALLGTKILDKIKKIYNEGGVIGGTSAGAAIMSKVMITGDELINKDTSNIFKMIKKGNVKVTEGFGFFKNVIVDQHFITRKRLNRLITVVLENPNLLGIGIDESTAVIVNPDNTFDVLGENTVMVYDATEANKITTDKNGNLSASEIKMHLLKSGDRFNLKTKSVISEN